MQFNKHDVAQVRTGSNGEYFVLVLQFQDNSCFFTTLGMSNVTSSITTRAQMNTTPRARTPRPLYFPRAKRSPALARITSLAGCRVILRRAGIIRSELVRQRAGPRRPDAHLHRQAPRQALALDARRMESGERLLNLIVRFYTTAEFTKVQQFNLRPREFDYKKFMLECP